MNHAIRITLSYEDCKHIISRWADRCYAAIVYQHDADEEISKTHVHIGLYGCETKAEALKRMWTDCPGKGNEFWSWKEANNSFGGETEDRSSDKYLTYMSKGTLRPVFVKNISEAIVETSRQAWVEPVKADRPGDASEHYIIEVLKKYERYPTLQSFTEHIAMEEGSCPWDLERVLHDIRSSTMKMFYHQTRRVPHATLYKSVAGSAFLRLCERWKVLDLGIGQLKNLWY